MDDDDEADLAAARAMAGDYLDFLSTQTIGFKAASDDVGVNPDNLCEIREMCGEDKDSLEVAGVLCRIADASARGCDAIQVNGTTAMHSTIRVPKKDEPSRQVKMPVVALGIFDRYQRIIEDAGGSYIDWKKARNAVIYNQISGSSMEDIVKRLAKVNTVKLVPDPGDMAVAYANACAVGERMRILGDMPSALPPEDLTAEDVIAMVKGNGVGSDRSHGLMTRKDPKFVNMVLRHMIGKGDPHELNDVFEYFCKKETIPMKETDDGFTLKAARNIMGGNAKSYIAHVALLNAGRNNMTDKSVESCGIGQSLFRDNAEKMDKLAGNKGQIMLDIINWDMNHSEELQELEMGFHATLCGIKDAHSLDLLRELTSNNIVDVNGILLKMKHSLMSGVYTTSKNGTAGNMMIICEMLRVRNYSVDEQIDYLNKCCLFYGDNAKIIKVDGCEEFSVAEITAAYKRFGAELKAEETKEGDRTNTEFIKTKTASINGVILHNRPFLYVLAKASGYEDEYEQMAYILSQMSQTHGVDPVAYRAVIEEIETKQMDMDKILKAAEKCRFYENGRNEDLTVDEQIDIMKSAFCEDKMKKLQMKRADVLAMGRDEELSDESKERWAALTMDNDEKLKYLLQTNQIGCLFPVDYCAIDLRGKPDRAENESELGGRRPIGCMNNIGKRMELIVPKRRREEAAAKIFSKDPTARGKHAKKKSPSDDNQEKPAVMEETIKKKRFRSPFDEDYEKPSVKKNKIMKKAARPKNPSYKRKKSEDEEEKAQWSKKAK